MASDSVGDTRGFFDLNLRMFCSVPIEQILYMKQEQTIELNFSPDCVRPVIRNLEALLTFVQPLTRYQGVQMMEEIHVEYPENINTVENLKTIYKDLKRENDVKRLDEKLNKLKDDNSTQSKYEKAKAFLEKGYALLMDMHSETQESPETKIEQALEELKIRTRRGLGLSSKSHREREAADNTIRWLKQARKNMSAIPERCIEETEAELMESVHNFKRGIDLLREVQADNEKVSSEIPVWKHHLGKALSRIGNTSRTIMRVGVKKDYLNDAVKEFIYCIENIMKDNHVNKIYLARSYAYLGHLFETKRNVIASKKKQMDQELGNHIALWENPMESFITSSELAPDDRVMLNRYGLTLMQRQTKEDIERKTNLFQALDVLNKSIENESVCNWFGYSLRMQVRVKMYKLQCKDMEENKADRKEKQPDQTLLQKALTDGEKCLSLRTTLEDLMNMAETYYLLGINQREKKNVKNRVKDVNQINIALAYLHRAREHHQCCQHSRLYSLLGKCLFDSGSYQQGIENMKIAMTTEPENVKDPNTFGELINFLLYDYQCKKDVIDLRDKKDSLRDIWCILLLGRQKYQTRSRFPLIGAVNKYPHEVIDILEFVVRNKNGYETKQLVDQFIAILKRHNGQRVKKRALNIEQKMPTGIGDDDDVSPASQEPESADMEKPDENQKKKFDFYVCHSDQDTDWVQVILLPGLQKNWKGDNIFSGCFKGYPRGLKFENVLGDVKVFLFILTPNFKKNERCNYELSTLMKISIDEPDRIHPGCLVPILMGDDKCMPDELKCYAKMDFTDCNYDWKKLRLVLAHNINGVHSPEPNRAEPEDTREDKLAHGYGVTMATGMANRIEKNGETSDTEHLSNSEAEQDLSADYPANERPPSENEANA